MTFPLPLTPFEEYMLRDGTPSHPMEFFFRLSFDGPLDRGSLAVAAAEACRRHPLLACRIAVPPGRTPRFECTGKPVGVAGLAAAAGALPAIPALAPDRGPLVRLCTVPRSDGGDDLLAQFHHAGCDGLGALAFLGDLCAILDATLACGRTRSEAPDPGSLRRRGRYGLDSWKLLRALPAQSRGLEGVWKFMRHRPVRLGPERATAGIEGAHRLQWADLAFGEDEARGLRNAALAAGVSLNELAAAALLEALCDACPGPAFGRARSVVRLSIPMNMRRPADRRLPAANVVSMVFLDRGPEEVARGGLERSLHEEMHLIKTLGLGMTFLFTLAVARHLPGGIGRFVADRSTAATALFTNLGRVFSRTGVGPKRNGPLRVGPRRLVAVDTLAPLRRGTALAVAATEYAGTLRFTLRSDPAVLDVEATNAIREAFARRLAGRAAAVPAPDTPAVMEACA